MKTVCHYIWKMAKHSGYVGNILMTYEGVEMTGIKFPFGYITQNMR